MSNTVREQLEKSIRYEFETMQILPSAEAVKDGAMSWDEVVDHKTNKLLALIEKLELEARIDELQKLNFKEASGFLYGGNHIVRQGVVTKRLKQLQSLGETGKADNEKG